MKELCSKQAPIQVAKDRTEISEPECKGPLKGNTGTWELNVSTFTWCYD